MDATLDLPVTRVCRPSLDQSPLLEIVFINDGCRIRRDLPSLLKEAFDVFADEVGFEIDGIVHLLEA